MSVTKLLLKTCRVGRVLIPFDWQRANKPTNVISVCFWRMRHCIISAQLRPHQRKGINMSCVITRTVPRQAGTVHVESHPSELIDGFKGFKDLFSSLPHFRKCYTFVLRAYWGSLPFVTFSITPSCIWYVHVSAVLCVYFFMHAVLCVTWPVVFLCVL